MNHQQRIDQLTQVLQELLPYAEAEAFSLEYHGKNDDRCKAEADEAWNAIEIARMALAN